MRSYCKRPKYFVGATVNVSGNSVDLDQTAPKEQSDLGLHCLPKVPGLDNTDLCKFKIGRVNYINGGGVQIYTANTVTMTYWQSSRNR